MNDTRLTDDELDLFVTFAYGGSAYRASRRAQAEALSNLFSGRPLDGGPGNTRHEAPSAN